MFLEISYNLPEHFLVPAPAKGCRQAESLSWAIGLLRILTECWDQDPVTETGACEDRKHHPEVILSPVATVETQNLGGGFKYGKPSFDSLLSRGSFSSAVSAVGLGWRARGPNPSSAVKGGPVAAWCLTPLTVPLGGLY